MPILNWIGKDAVVNHDKDVPFRLLKKTKSKSVGDSENLIIEGDNLEALKALLPHYQNKIKCIYIDPPYNTGNEGWVYNDNVNSPKIKKWLGKVVGGEDEDLTRNDKWLCMMYPRLKLLRELLNNEGIIFVSIDDNEVGNLRSIMDEIFDKKNFVAQLTTVMNLKGNNDEFGFAGTHEYVLVYAKDLKNSKIGEFKIEGDELDDWQKDDWGFYKKGANLKSTGINAPREKRPNLFFPIYVSEDNIVHVSRQTKNDVEIFPITDGMEMSWRWKKSKMQDEPYNIIVVNNNDKISIYKKQRPTLNDLPSKKPKTLFYKPEYSSGNGTEQLKRIFGKKIFQNPKPLDLIKDLLEIGCGKDGIVLDSFAGSGTTGHAVLKLNEEDDGDRKFILIELDSKICKSITATRLKKVITGYTYNSIKVMGLNGDFQYAVLDKKLFNADGRINPECTFEELASYLYFTETKTILDTKKIKKTLLDTHNDTQIHLMFDGIGKNNLDRKFLSTLDKNKDKIIYADKCTLDDLTLEKHKTVFKQIPYEVKKF
jgi:adenine-specific DNA-methyltransferase